MSVFLRTLGVILVLFGAAGLAITSLQGFECLAARAVLAPFSGFFAPLIVVGAVMVFLGRK